MRFLFIFLFSSTLHAQAVYYVGDSHSYVATPSQDLTHRKRLGHVLIEHFKAQGIPFYYSAACGATAQSWSSGGTTTCGYTRSFDGVFVAATNSSYPAIDLIFALEPMRMLIVNLGDNMFTWTGNAAGKKVASLDPFRFRRELNAFFAKVPEVSDRMCVWIGPTYHPEGTLYKKSNAIVDTFYQEFAAAVAGRCRLVDSREMVLPLVPGDGLHHTNSDSELWGEGIVRAL